MSFRYSGGPFSFWLNKTMMTYIVHKCLGPRHWQGISLLVEILRFCRARISTPKWRTLWIKAWTAGSGFEFYVFLHCSKHFVRVFSCFFRFRLLGGTAMLGMDSRYMAVFLLPWLESLTLDLVVSHSFQAVDLVPFKLESTLLSGMVCKIWLYSSGQNPGPIGIVGLANLLRFFQPLKPWKHLKAKHFQDSWGIWDSFNLWQAYSTTVPGKIAHIPLNSYSPPQQCQVIAGRRILHRTPPGSVGALAACGCLQTRISWVFDHHCTNLPGLLQAIVL